MRESSSAVRRLAFVASQRARRADCDRGCRLASRRDSPACARRKRARAVSGVIRAPGVGAHRKRVGSVVVLARRLRGAFRGRSRHPSTHSKARMLEDQRFTFVGSFDCRDRRAPLGCSPRPPETVADAEWLLIAVHSTVPRRSERRSRVRSESFGPGRSAPTLTGDGSGPPAVSGAEVQSSGRPFDEVAPSGWVGGRCAPRTGRSRER